MDIRTRYYPRTAKRPARITATALGGNDDGRKETFRWDGSGAHLRAAQQLARLCGVDGAVVEVHYRDTGSTFRVMGRTN